MADDSEAVRFQLERDKLQADIALRERELGLKERALLVQDEELRLRQLELRRSRWSNPLVLAVLAAAVAAFGNAVVTWLSGDLQRKLEIAKATEMLMVENQRSLATHKLEESRFEAARILEVIKTGDPDKAAENLKFLLDAGLISEPRRTELRNLLAARAPGKGPTLPVTVSVTSGQIVAFPQTPEAEQNLQSSGFKQLDMPGGIRGYVPPSSRPHVTPDSPPSSKAKR